MKPFIAFAMQTFLTGSAALAGYSFLENSNIFACLLIVVLAAIILIGLHEMIVRYARMDGQESMRITKRLR